MASSIKLPFVLFLSSLFLHATLAEIICESLPKDVCSFAISSSGKRCLLESVGRKYGSMEYQCKASEVIVERMAGYIETDQCVNACGVDRNAVGISSDALLCLNLLPIFARHTAIKSAQTLLTCTSIWLPEKVHSCLTFAGLTAPTLVEP